MTLPSDFKKIRKHVIIALDRELKIKSRDPTSTATSEARKQSKESDYLYRVVHKNLLKHAKRDAKRNLLYLRALRDQTGYYITDQDRAIVNEAIRAKLQPKFIALLLEDYPNACESGGCVDHIDHPIHNACTMHRQAVSAILRSAPDCANQRNKDGKLPLQLFLDNSDMIDITSEEYIHVINQFAKLNPGCVREPFLRSHSLKQQVLMRGFLPDHLKNTLEPEHEEVFEQIKEEIEIISRRISMNSSFILNAGGSTH